MNEPNFDRPALDRAGWSPTLLYFVGLAFGAEQVGLLSHPTYATLAIVFLTGGVLWRTRGVDGSPRTLGIGVLVAAGLLLTPLPLELRFFAFALVFAGVARVRGDTRPSDLEHMLAMTCLFFGIYQFLVSNSPLAWHARQEFALATSGWVSLRGSFTAGPTYAATDLMVLVVSAGFARWWLYGERRNVAITIVATLACTALYLSLAGSLALLARSESSWLTRSSSLVYSALHPLSYGWLSVPLLALPAVWCLRLRTAEAARVGDSRGRRGVLVTCAIAAIVPLLLLNPAPAPRPSDGAAPRIALYERGFLNWGRPRPDRFGPSSVGMLGMLPELLRTKGLEATLVDTLDPATLESFDALVLINQTEPFSGATLQAIDTFVQDGGGLLVLGDHTAWRHDEVLINQPLADRAIRFNFDNAEFFVGGWLHSCRFWSHPVMTGLDDHENTVGSVIGASLDIDYPAVPLVVGQYGFSDPGNVAASERGYMGNREHDPAEPIGDVVLAALQDVGDGRLAVVGDTTAFSNGVMTLAWPFVSPLFDWLVSDARATVAWPRELGCLALLLIGGLGLRRFDRRVPAEIVIATLLVSIGVTTHAGSWGDWHQPPGTADPVDGSVLPVAIIDHSHLTKCSREGIHDDGYGGLARNLMRDDFVVLQSREFDAELFRGAEVIFINAPGRPYSAEEVATLHEFAASGGDVVLAIGRNDRRCASSLLRHWNFRVHDLPVGRDTIECAFGESVPTTFEGWAVEGAEPIAWYVDATEADTKARHPVVVRKAVGRGHVTLIGDGHFWRDKNLETPDGPYLQNIRFLRDTIALTRDGSQK